jgi:hypothetical protein
MFPRFSAPLLPSVANVGFGGITDPENEHKYYTK